MKIYFPGGSRVYADYKGFTIKTDQPKDGGGENTAPSPFDYFLASVGTCAGIYALRFIEQRNLPKEGLEIRLDTEYDESKHMLGQIQIRILLPEGFPEKYKSALIKTVNLCTVKKHMHDPPRFRTSIQIGDRVVEETVQ